MARRPRPWPRTSRGWCVTIDGKQVSLGKDKKRAYQSFHDLMSGPKRPPRTSCLLVSSILDDFLQWTKNHREPATYESCQLRLQSLLDRLPQNPRARETAVHHKTVVAVADAIVENVLVQGPAIAMVPAFLEVRYSRARCLGICPEERSEYLPESQWCDIIKGERSPLIANGRISLDADDPTGRPCRHALRALQGRLGGRAGEEVNCLTVTVATSAVTSPLIP